MKPVKLSHLSLNWKKYLNYEFQSTGIGIFICYIDLL